MSEPFGFGNVNTGPGSMPFSQGGMPPIHSIFEMLPGMDNPAIALSAMMLMGGPLQRMGVASTLQADMNFADFRRNQSFYDVRQRLIQDTADLDRDRWTSTLRGMSAMAGVPWGADQIAAADRITRGMVQFSPMLAQMAPEVLDAMGGRRGSITGLAASMASINRYRIDPTTGQVGMSEANLKAATENLFGALYDTSGGATPLSLTAGRAGAALEQLFQRGMAGGDVGAGLRGGPGAGGIAGKDTAAIKAKLTEYASSINAINDIFAELGQPNAPMGQLMAALDKLSNGGLSVLQPDQLSRLVRTTQQLSTMSGMSIQTMSAIGGALGDSAARMGLEYQLGADARNVAAGYTIALKNTGLNTAAWGRKDINANTMQAGQDALQAAGSDAANYLNVMLRLNNDVTFKPGGEAEKVAQAIAAGQAPALRQGDVVRMLQAEGLSIGQINTFMGDRSANRQYSNVSGPQVWKQMTGSVIERDAQMVRGMLQRSGVNATPAQVNAVVSDVIDNMGQLTGRDLNSAVAKSLSEHGIQFAAGRGGMLAEEVISGINMVGAQWGFGGIAQQQSRFGRTVREQAVGAQEMAGFRGDVAAAVTTFGRGNAMSRVFEYLATSQRPEFAEAMFSAFGLKGGTAYDEMVGTLNSVNQKRIEVDALIAEYGQTTDPNQRKALAGRIQTARNALNADVQKIDKAATAWNPSGETATAADAATARDQARQAGGLMAQAGTAARGDFWTHEAGRSLSYAANRANRSAENIAEGLISDAGAAKYGIEGYNIGKNLTKTQQDLVAAAAKYTDGDIAKLQAGDFTASDDEKKRVTGLFVSRESNLAEAQKVMNTGTSKPITKEEAAKMRDRDKLSAAGMVMAYAKTHLKGDVSLNDPNVQAMLKMAQEGGPQSPGARLLYEMSQGAEGRSLLSGQQASTKDMLDNFTATAKNMEADKPTKEAKRQELYGTLKLIGNDKVVLTGSMGDEPIQDDGTRIA